MSFHRIFTVSIAVSVAALLCGGCGGGSQGVEPVVDRAGTLGTWIEVPAEEAPSNNPRFVAPPPRTKNLRQLTINDDGTFVMEMMSPGGGASGEGKVEGTWAIADGYVNFTSSSNGLPQDLQTMEPMRTKGKDVAYDENEKARDVLRVTDLEGIPAEFVRKS